MLAWLLFYLSFIVSWVILFLFSFLYLLITENITLAHIYFVTENIAPGSTCFGHCFVSYSNQVTLLTLTPTAIFQWFKDNEMKANEGKCHELLGASNELTVKINEAEIKNS